MKRVKFEADERHMLRIGNRKIHGGATADVTDEEAEELLTNPHVNVSLVTEGDLTRAELNELAKEAGIENPESLPNKQAVQDAIEEITSESDEEE